MFESRAMNHNYERHYSIVIDFLRSVERLAGITLSKARSVSPLDPIGYAVRTACIRAVTECVDGSIIIANDMSGVPSGFIAIKLPGSGFFAYDSMIHSFNAERAPKQIGIIELVAATNALRWTVAGQYVLLHYDLLACYSNSVIDYSCVWTFCDHILEECRSVVVDIDHLTVVSLPFYKFHNLDENEDYCLRNVREAIKANFGDVQITEKLDGSMIQMKYVQGSEDVFTYGLLYSTSNTLAYSASAPKNEHLKSLVEHHLTDNELDKHLALCMEHPELTFIFEFVHPSEDPHVIAYSAEREGLYLIGARNIYDGLLVKRDVLDAIAAKHGVPRPAVVARSLDEALALQKNGEGTIMEGMVADIDGWLVKIKLDSFLRLSRIHHALDSAQGFKAICDALYNETLDDMIAVLPPLRKELVNATIERLDAYNREYEKVFQAVLGACLAESGAKPENSAELGAWRKRFALAARELSAPLVTKDLFAWANGKYVDGRVHWADYSETSDGTVAHFLKKMEFERRSAIIEEYARELEKNGVL